MLFGLFVSLRLPRRLQGVVVCSSRARCRVVPAATAARAKNGSVDAGIYQFQSIEEDTRYAVTAAVLPASKARLLRLLVLKKAL